MRIVVSKVNLAHALGRCQGVCDRKSTMPVIAHVLLSTGEAGVELSATDLNLSLRMELPAEIDQPGCVAIRGKELLERVKNMPDGQIVLESEDGTWVKVRTPNGKRQFTLPALPGDAFPKLPVAASDGRSLDIAAGVLGRLIAATQFSISSDDARPHLNSALLEWEPTFVRVVTTDGHRLSRADHPIGGPSERSTMMLPLKGIQELRRLADELPEDVVFTLVESGGTAFFSVPGVEFGVKLVDAVFPPYQQVIPTRSDRMLRANRAQLIGAVRAVSIAASGVTDGIQLVASGETLRLKSESSDDGSGFDELPITHDGSDVAVDLNARYLVEALGALDSEDVVLAQAGTADPVVVKSADGEARLAYLGVIMPLRV